MNYLDYKERFFKGEKIEDIVLTFSDLKAKNQYLKDLSHFGKLKVQSDLPLSTQTQSVYGESLKSLDTDLTGDEKLLLKRPVENDIAILDLEFVIFIECTALFEYWSWDGIWGGSLIILKKDLPSKNIDAFIHSLLTQVNYTSNDPYTSKEKGEYFFINYNFHESEK